MWSVSAEPFYICRLQGGCHLQSRVPACFTVCMWSGLPASRNVSLHCLLFISHPFMGFLLQHLKETEMCDLRAINVVSIICVSDLWYFRWVQEHILWKNKLLLKKYICHQKSDIVLSFSLLPQRVRTLSCFCFSWSVIWPQTRSLKLSLFLSLLSSWHHRGYTTTSTEGMLRVRCR
jgi:phosphoglycerol transferase MdoB-like AlkP superfamily enzyme